MYINTEYEITNYFRKSKYNKPVEYTRKKKIYIFSCDVCNIEFRRDSNFDPKRLNNNYKHFCDACKNQTSMVGIIKKQSKLKLNEKITNGKGYVLIRVSSTEDYPGKRTANFIYVREHVKIIQDHLGRRLNDNEVVHHIDGDKSNNDISNLDLCTQKEHNMCHASSEKVIFELYKKNIVKYDRITKKYYI
jgi:HNH endonuclease